MKANAVYFKNGNDNLCDDQKTLSDQLRSCIIAIPIDNRAKGYG